MAEGDRKTVLIVEDDVNMLDSLKERIERQGYKVTPVFYRSPQTILPKERFDCLIVDGLAGKHMEVIEKTNAERVIVYSACGIAVSAAKDRGQIGIRKGEDDSLKKVLEAIV